MTPLGWMRPGEHTWFCCTESQGNTLFLCTQLLAILAFCCERECVVSNSQVHAQPQHVLQQWILGELVESADGHAIPFNGIAHRCQVWISLVTHHFIFSGSMSSALKLLGRVPSWQDMLYSNRPAQEQQGYRSRICSITLQVLNRGGWWAVLQNP